MKEQRIDLRLHEAANKRADMFNDVQKGAIAYTEFIEGALWMLNNLWHDAEGEHPTVDRNCLIEMVDGRIAMARWDGAFWNWADGVPVGINDKGDLMYSSWCSIDTMVNRWCYVQNLFPENKRK